MRMHLGDIADFINGYGFKQTDWNNDGLPIIRIQNLTDESKPFNRTILNTDKKYIVERGDILVSWSATLGVFEWSREKALLNQHIFKVIPNSQLIDKKYLFYSLQNALSEMNKHLHGATMRHINRKEFVNTKINVPSLDEQRRIAKILDKANAIKCFESLSLEKVEELKRQLFIDRFGKRNEPYEKFQCSLLSDCAIQITDGEHQTPRRSSTGHHLLSARNIKNGYICLKDVDYVDQEEFNRISKRCCASQGDILISCSGTIGRVSQVRGKHSFVMVRSAALVKPDQSKILPDFLEAVLSSPYLQAQMQRASNKSSQANLFQGKIKELKIFIPPISKQKSFCEELRNVIFLKENFSKKLNHLNDLNISTSNILLTNNKL